MLCRQDIANSTDLGSVFARELRCHPPACSAVIARELQRHRPSSAVIAREGGRSSKHRTSFEARSRRIAGPVVTGCPASAGHDSGGADSGIHQNI